MQVIIAHVDELRLLDRRHRERGFEGVRYHRPMSHIPMFVFSSSNFALVLGFTKHYRYAAFVHRCLAKHLRRYLLVAGVQHLHM